MQHIQRRVRRRAKQEGGWAVGGGLTDGDGRVRDYARYTHRLQLYDVPPDEEVSLEEFEVPFNGP